MELEEYIADCERVVRECPWPGSVDEARQVAEWLKELRQYREKQDETCLNVASDASYKQVVSKSGDLISRQDALDALSAFVNLDEYYHNRKCKNIPMLSAKRYLENAPSLEGVTGVIRCADCKWWDRLEDDHPYGNCRACRSGTHTERWEISIQRQCKFDFFCADAEPKEEDDDENA